MQPYQYKPLPSSSSIRILILYPADNTWSSLECDIITNDRLRIVQGPDIKTFDAVSYVWGTGMHSIPLYCRSEGTYLYISAVVDEMLRSLRKSGKQRRLWVDALCLNQKDNHEKSIQVQQMGQIYHMADKVHIWLGAAVATTPLAFAFLRTLVVRFEPTPSQARDPTTEEILDTFEQTFKRRNVQPVLDLLEKSWFTRRWTLQEGFLGREAIVRCGSSKISWPWFTAGLRLIHKRSQELQGIQDSHSALYALNVLKMLQKPEDLLSLLWTFHMSECSDPRDRIYSLLGLAQKMNKVAPVTEVGGSTLQGHSNSNNGVPVPDYSLNAEAVYRGFAGHCISTDRFLELLLHIDAFGGLSEVNPNWPSWVPNWARARDRKRGSPTATSRIMPVSHCVDKTRDLPRDLRDCVDTGPAVYRMIHLGVSRLPDAHDFFYLRPIEHPIGNHHNGLILYGWQITKTVEVRNAWTSSTDSEYLARYLADWIHQKVILHLPVEKLTMKIMQREVMKYLILLITGIEFFGYANHSLLQNAEDLKSCDKWVHGRHDSVVYNSRDYMPCVEKCRRIAYLLYPLARGPWYYTSEQVHLKKHLNETYKGFPLPTAEDRQELFQFLGDVSRMMREGKKQLVAQPLKETPTSLIVRHWIAPSDIMSDDIFTSISQDGKIGALLRPVGSLSGLNGRPVFRFIGILWSFEQVHCHKPLGTPTQPEEFLIL
jgi:hypothetical protein